MPVNGSEGVSTEVEADKGVRGVYLPFYISTPVLGSEVLSTTSDMIVLS